MISKHKMESWNRKMILVEKNCEIQNRERVLVEKLVKYEKACSSVASGVLALRSWAGGTLQRVRC